jgi:phospholipid/cholesterol/gamma-HCH transport system substrate-binding protein
MRHRREILVGLSIVIAVLIFIFGVRFFQDLPILGGSYTLHTSFATAQGLVSGSPVQIRGVSVGTVRGIQINPEARRVDVEFQVHHGVEVPEGSSTSVTGLAMLGNVILDIELGPHTMPPLPPDSHLPGLTGTGLDAIIDRAPEFAARADSVLIALQTTLGRVDGIVSEQSVLLAQTMLSLRNTSDRVNRLVAGQAASIDLVMDNLGAISTDVRAITGESGDSLRLAFQQAHRLTARMDTGLTNLQMTAARVDSLLRQVESGEGTLGLLAQDPSLYHNLDSTMASLNRLLLSFERNPARFLRELTLIDLF